jgi:hypothetical protein
VPIGSIENPTVLAESMPALAKKVIAVYREPDRRLYLDNLFRLQLAAGDNDAAIETIDALRALDAGNTDSSATRFQKRSSGADCSRGIWSS